MKFPTEPIKIHFFYIVVILILMIIWLSTWMLAGDTSVLSHISLAATIASLILAVLAIVYAYLSNLSLMVNLGQLSQVSRDFVDNTDRLTEVRSDLKEYLDTVQNIESKVNLYGEQHKEQLETINLRLSQELASDPQSVELSETVLEQFVDRLTLNGQYLLYILKWGHEQQGLFAFEDITNKLNFFWGNEFAVTAYLDSFSALGLAEVATNRRSDPDGGFLPTLYTVTYFHPLVATKIDDKMRGSSWQSSSPTNAARFESDLMFIEDYFTLPRG